MLRLAQRSSILSTSMRLLASTSVVHQQDRNVSTKKAVVFNMGGTVIPTMKPVLEKFAKDMKITEEKLTSQLFIDGDEKLMDQVEPKLILKNGSHNANLFDFISAIQGIKAEGLKAALISDAKGLNPGLIPINMEMFDAVSPELNAGIPQALNMDASEVVYIDNSEANLKLAEGLGMTTVNFGEMEAALTEVESHLKVPLKPFVSGWTWMYYDRAHNPFKSTADNMLFYVLCVWLFVFLFKSALTDVFKIDGSHDIHKYNCVPLGYCKPGDGTGSD